MKRVYSKRFDEAFGYAYQLHKNQVRKGTDIPYISHLLAVASLVIEADGDEDEVIAALLHDAAEDQGGEIVLAEIRNKFGDNVAKIVHECSDTFDTPKPPWEARKKLYLSHLISASESALKISCADKLHNARAILSDYRSIGDAIWERFTGGKEGTLWYYQSLVEIYNSNKVSLNLSRELENVVKELTMASNSGNPGKV